MDKQTQRVNELCKRWVDTGRIAFVYPRLRQVSLNGGKRKSYAETISYLNNFFKEVTA